MTIFQTKLVHNQIQLSQTEPLRFTHQKRYQLFTYLRAGFRFVQTTLSVEKPLQGAEESIIQQIHTIRYNEENPYVITGGHFYQIFVRNLGVFFNALLDPRIPSREEDWYHRQSIALRTLAYDLALFSQADREYTTLTPITKNLYSGFNFYARPSDSLFAIVYTFCALLDESFIQTIFPAKSQTKHQLQTQQAAKKLLQTYSPILKKLLKTYRDELIDAHTGLIKTNLLLASARDGIKRQSSFYDNVIAWTTIRLANKLNLYTITEAELKQWKQQIITTYWDSTGNIFLDDLSDDSKNHKRFSADSFIVTSAQFLDIRNKKERRYLEGMVRYVKKHKLDKPFPLQYSTVDLPKRLYRPVRYCAPTYMGTSIWCHWGIEYIKVLIYLSKENPILLNDAKKHLAAYKNNIERYGGYPETYDKDGKILSTRLYRSVLYNGWVINYEQTKMLLSNEKL